MFGLSEESIRRLANLRLTGCFFGFFQIIRDNLAGGKRSTRDRRVCMFTDPPLARVGLTGGEAQRQRVTARVAKLPIRAVLRTQRPTKDKVS